MANTEKPVVLSGVSKSFGKCQALSEISYEVEPGTVFALLGENGAGKTTTIKLLLGQLQPDQGEVHVLGRVPLANDKELRRHIGYVPESVFLYDWMTVEEMGRFAAAFYSDTYGPEYKRLTEAFGLSPHAKIRSLSKGMKAEVSLSLALAANPELLILDEPTSGLDALVRRKFMENMVDLASTGKTVFLSSHQISEVERVADHVAIMKKSRVLLVEPLDALKESTQLVQMTFNRNITTNDPVLTRLSNELFDSTIETQCQGRILRILGRRFNADVREKAMLLLPENTEMTACDIFQPSLEDIFIALMNSDHERKEVRA